MSTQNISAIPLEIDAYRPYGDVISARADIPWVSANMGTAERYNWVGKVENLREKTAAPNLCLFRVNPFTGGSVFDVKLLERHAYTTQVLIPMGGTTRFLVIVCRGGDTPDLSTLRAFVARGDQGITYYPGTWHHPLIALENRSDFACLVYEDKSDGDCDLHPLAVPVRVLF